MKSDIHSLNEKIITVQYKALDAILGGKTVEELEAILDELDKAYLELHKHYN